MPLVTLLIIAYNSEKWIETALQSVINQTHQDLQILIINDGSEDKTLEKILSFNDPRIELYTKSHSSISSSFNFAMKKIRGDFIGRLDADDYCDRERIRKQLKFLLENPSYGIAGSNFLLIDDLGEQIDKIRNPEKHKDIAEQLPRHCCIWVGSVLMRREIANELNGYNECLLSGNDWDFFLRAIGLTKFYNIQEFLTTKRFHPASISFSEIAKKETEEILLSFNNSLIQNSKDEKEIGKAYFNIGYHFYYKSDFDNSNNYFSEALSRGFNLQYYRYFIFSKYLKGLIRISRKYKIYKMFNWLRYLDNSNKYLRRKF